MILLTNLRARTLVVIAFGCWASMAAKAQAVNSPYPQMAPLQQYMMPENEEIAWARSAAPASISAKADVMVLRRDGYATAVKGTSGWVCMVERGWASNTDAPDFWNPKLRAPHCFNPPAARSFLPIYLMKTKMVMAGRDRKRRLCRRRRRRSRAGSCRRWSVDQRRT
jgi:hypothetical protein